MTDKIKRGATFAACFLLILMLLGLFFVIRDNERQQAEQAEKEAYEQVAQNFRDRYFQNKDNLYLLWDGTDFPVADTATKKATVNFRADLRVDWGDGTVTDGGNYHSYTDDQRYHLIVVSGNILQADMPIDMFYKGVRNDKLKGWKFTGKDKEKVRIIIETHEKKKK